MLPLIWPGNFAGFKQHDFSKFGMRRVLTSIPARTTNIFITYNGEFDPGSGRTLAACLTHASQGEHFLREIIKLANG